MGSFENLKMYWQLSPFTNALFLFLSNNNQRVLTELWRRNINLNSIFTINSPFLSEK